MNREAYGKLKERQTRCQLVHYFNHVLGQGRSRLDCRQLGIMVVAFLNDIPAKSYQSREPKPTDLVETGVYNSASFTDWDPKVDLLS